MLTLNSQFWSRGKQVLTRVSEKYINKSVLLSLGQPICCMYPCIISSLHNISRNNDCQSLSSTVLFRATHTRTITIDKLLILSPGFKPFTMIVIFLWMTKRLSLIDLQKSGTGWEWTINFPVLHLFHSAPPPPPPPPIPPSLRPFQFHDYN